MLNSGQIIEARYEIVNKIEEDSHGTVYLGHHVTLNKQITIKEINGNTIVPDERREITSVFIEKTRTFAKLEHLSLPKIMDFFPSGEHFYIIMDYIKGENLENFMKLRHLSPLEEKDVINYVIKVCKIIWFLHNQRPVPLFMGNLNPANIIIGYDGNISLVSFGINRYVNKTNYTKSGFTAPEAYRNKVTPLSDMFSIGSIMYYMITGLNPAVSRHTNYDLPSVRSVNPDASLSIERIIKKATNIEPFARFDNMKEMKKALEDCLTCPEVPEKKDSEESIFKTSPMKLGNTFDKEIGHVLDGLKDTKILESDITQELIVSMKDDEPVYEISSKNLDEDPMEKIARRRAKTTEKLREKQKAAYEAVEKIYREKEIAQRKELKKFIIPAVVVISLILFIIFYVITHP